MKKNKIIFTRFLLTKERRETMSQQSRDLYERLWNERENTGRSPAFHNDMSLARESYQHIRELPLAREELVQQGLITFVPATRYKDGRPIHAGNYTLTPEALRESNEVVSSARFRGVIPC